MSFMREIINIVSENEALDARENITRCLEHIRSYQQQIKTYIDDDYCDYLLDLGSNKLYLTEGARLCDEAELLLQNVSNETRNDLLAANDDLHGLTEELTEAAVGMRVSHKIVRLDALFRDIAEANGNREYLSVLEYTAQLKHLLDDPDDTVLPQLDCYTAIRLKYAAEARMLQQHLREQFESMVQLTERKFQNIKSVAVRITRDENQLHDTIVALLSSNYDPQPMCTFLMDNIFVPIVRQPVSLQLNDNDAAQVTLTLSYSLVAPGGNDNVANLRPHYRTVFANIQLAFQCLGHMNIALTPERCVFGVFADAIKARFVQLLLDECLTPAVPSTMDEMNESTLVDDLLAFNQFLCDMLFLREELDGELKQFAGSVDVLFANRFCTNIVESAVAIMRHDLHDMVLVGEEARAADQPASSTGDAFDRCMVSKSTTELTNLMDKVVRQASKDEQTVGLLATIPAIVERYVTDVPTFHARLLQNIPQQTALFHNNCQYLAHWLTQNAARAATGAADQDAATFASRSTALRHCGTSLFGQQTAHQRDQLMQIMRDFDIAKCTDELDPRAMKIVRQCLRQLDLLKNVWQTILPADVYNRTMATVLHELCAELIRRVLALDDIPAAVCTGLVEILDDMERRAPVCFADELQVSVLCRSWTKLMQLRMMLNASMAHIVEQWAEGKGPLTLHYRAAEVKHLIRALFQNTDRRANALSTIV